MREARFLRLTPSVYAKREPAARHDFRKGCLDIRMAALEDKIDNALHEVRTLILGSQVLVGIELRSAFESGFDRLPQSERFLKLGGLVLMLFALGLLVSPAAYHRIVEGGDISSQLHLFITRVSAVALLPFALGLGIDLHFAAGMLWGPAVAIGAGVAATLLALLFWYGIEEAARARGQKRSKREESGGSRQTPDLSDRVHNVLTELRVVLPGAQALLGFQLIATLTDSFERMPRPARMVHLASLALIALTTILLMAPAAWHRIVEEGENTERFHRIASLFVLWSLVFLGLGVSVDFFVFFEKVTQSRFAAGAAAATALLFYYGFWFGYTIYRRSKKER